MHMSIYRNRFIQITRKANLDKEVRRKRPHRTVSGLSELRTSAYLFLLNTVTYSYTPAQKNAKCANNFGINTLEFQINQWGKEACMVIKTNRHGSVEQSRVASATDNDY